MTKRLNWWDFAHTTEPDIWLLERILHSDNQYDRDQIKAIKLKYQALIAKPTIIEKIMSPEQLFNARTHCGRRVTPFKNCTTGLNFANPSMDTTEGTRLSE